MKKIWDAFYKNQKCSICGTVIDSKYKGVCDSCYGKKYRKRPERQTNSKQIYQLRKKVLLRRSKTLKTDFCKRCGEVGRYRLFWNEYKKTGKIEHGYLSVTHFKYDKTIKRKKHVRDCYLWTVPKDVIEAERAKIIKPKMSMKTITNCPHTDRQCFSLGMCKQCYDKQYRDKPEIRAKRRKYAKRPEVRAKKQEYAKRPEVRAKRHEYNKKYNKRPEIKAMRLEYAREYRNKPEVKAKRLEWAKEYRKKPETKAKLQEYAKEYRGRPEVKARVREYYQRPDIRAKHRAYSKEYHQRPEVRDRMRAYYQQPEVKARMREYLNRPEIRVRQKEYEKRYFQKPAAQAKRSLRVGYKTIRPCYLCPKCKLLVRSHQQVVTCAFCGYTPGCARTSFSYFGEFKKEYHSLIEIRDYNAFMQKFKEGERR